MGQLTLVEHSLCPLDPDKSLTEGLKHQVSYFYTDKNRHARKANVEIYCPLGLSATDELYLWGLLALTEREPDSEGELYATPHFILRQLGLIDEHSRRGGRQYQQFRQALDRLACVRYRNERFYDPVRCEHRQILFGFFSYSLPRNPESCRAWRIIWDPLFFEFAQSIGGHLEFELAVYRQLTPACRRLFLLLLKIFNRRT